MEFIVETPQSLLDFLSTKYPDSSKTTLRGWIAGGRVEVEGAAAKIANVQLKSGQKVQMGPRAKVFRDELKIIYEDRDLVVIDKPEGLLSVATDFDLDRSAHALLKKRFHRPRIFPVHRLDRETSGLLVFAYTEEAKVGLKAQFEEHLTEREYRAVVHGHLPEKKGTFQSYLSEDARYFVRSGNEGKLAITHYEVVETRGEKSLLKVVLETGRKNQIRVHLSEAGFPIVGDRKYGSETDDAPRLYLHAMELGFVHPVTKKALHFHSPCPF